MVSTVIAARNESERETYTTDFSSFDFAALRSTIQKTEPEGYWVLRF